MILLSRFEGGRVSLRDFSIFCARHVESTSNSALRNPILQASSSPSTTPQASAVKVEHQPTFLAHPPNHSPFQPRITTPAAARPGLPHEAPSHKIDARSKQVRRFDIIWIKNLFVSVPPSKPANDCKECFPLDSTLKRARSQYVANSFRMSSTHWAEVIAPTPFASLDIGHESSMCGHPEEVFNPFRTLPVPDDFPLWIRFAEFASH
ncbi:putative ribonuclease H protein [Senna tora]|uniref:Putative ribonuclease H protein n=1 Tax=Senna tora TaxID=362788 RepID=A0A835C9S1_9FABA|nr:putative ribonuclease H protein [Senna tora]